MVPEPVKVLKVHVAIYVRNVQRSTEFYRKLFGIEPSKLRKGYAKFDVQNPPLNFTLNELQPDKRATSHPSLSHLGIQVDSTADVLAMRESWAREGLAPRDEMQTECCHALQDKAWVSDPDGNEWEVFVVLKDGLPEKEQHAEPRSCCASTCCTPAPAETAQGRNHVSI